MPEKTGQRLQHDRIVEEFGGRGLVAVRRTVDWTRRREAALEVLSQEPAP